MTLPLDTAKAAAASSKLRLHHISLFSVEAQVLSTPRKVALRFDVSHREALWHIIDDISLVCIFGVDLVIGSTETGELEPLANIAVGFRAEYRFEDSYAPADEELLEHYVGIVGRLHAWPYIRAEIQELSTKLGLPPLTLPVIVSGSTVNLAVKRWEDSVTAADPPVPELPEAAMTPVVAKAPKKKLKRARAAKR